jgi:hypothetical protein
LSSRLPEYPAIQYLNRLQDERIKILGLFLGKRLYYFDKPVIFGTNIFEERVKQVAETVTLASQLQKMGYTHCMIGVDRFKIWANTVFSSEQRQTIRQWLQENCTLLKNENGYAIFRLTPDDGSSPSILRKGRAS